MTPALKPALSLGTRVISSARLILSFRFQSSASECILVCMLAARAQAIKELKKRNPDKEDSAFLPELVAYCSQESHSCVEKAAMICLVKLRILEPDDKCSLRGFTLKEVRKQFKSKFYLGT